MKMRRAIFAFLAIVCIFSTLTLFTLGASAEGERVVYATTRSSTVQQGSHTYLDVYLDDLTNLSALSVSVYYDPEQVTVKNTYNSVSATVQDINATSGCVNASYIFDGKGEAKKTKLFYFYFQVNSTAEAGDVYFDIVINEAYDNSLNDIPFTGSRCSFKVTEKAVSKTCTISSTSTKSTSVGEEFELSYRFSTYQIASGAMAIQYDPELFEVVSVKEGTFLSNKLFDVNTELKGSIYLSFIGTSYQSKYDIVTVRFKTLKNVSESSDIKLTVSELHDVDLNPYTCQGYTSKVNISFDDSYTEDAPSMSASASYSEDTGKVTVNITLEKDSMLGAGDFVLRFDNDLLSYDSLKKELDAAFFIVNDTKIEDGELIFYVISTENITEAQSVLTVTFNANHACVDKLAEFEISGSNLTDSLTNKIVLNFVDTRVTIPEKHVSGEAFSENREEPTCTETGKYESVINCSLCSKELSREEVILEKAAHSYTSAGDCSICGEYRAKFSGASLTLEDNIAVNFKVAPEQFVGTGYSEPFVVFNFNGEAYTVSNYTLDSNERYAFTFSDIAPRMMNDLIYATLYATYEGEIVACQTRSYSVKEYCYNMLARCEEGGIYANNNKFKALLVDLLNYGEAAQIYGNYCTDNPVTDDLTDEQRGWATEESPTVGTVQNLTYKVIENPTVVWKAGGLLLEDAVTMRFKLAAESIEGLKVTFYTNSNPSGWTVDYTSFVETNGGYYVYFDGLKARQMRETVYVTVYNGNEAVSNTVSYSIESYAYAKRNDTNKKLTDLLEAMMKYGDSAYRYINE